MERASSLIRFKSCSKMHSVPMNYLIDGDSGKVLATAIHGENMIQTVDKVMAERIRK